MSMPEELTAPSQHNPDEVLDLLVGEGFAIAQGRLESALYTYQWSKNFGNYNKDKPLRSTELKPDIQSGIEDIVTALGVMGINEVLLRQRIERLGFIFAEHEEVIKYKEGKRTVGYYDLQKAVAVSDKSATGVWANHITIHETVHGLQQSQGVFKHNDKFVIIGNGLAVARAHNGDKLESLIPNLTRVDEATIDMVALRGSRLAMDEYVQKSSYAIDMQALLETNKHNPKSIYDILQAMFITGIQSLEHAQALVFASGLSVV
jgi:hypothetical protein